MRLLSVCVAGLTAAGCTTPNGAWEADYRTVLQAADPAARTAALGTVAEGAADAGDVATVRRCLEALADDPSHDRVADAAAIRLGNRGDWFAACGTAKRVKDPTARKAALDKVGGVWPFGDGP